MPIPSGVETRLVIGKETTWGVKPLATAGKLTRRTTVTLDLTRDMFESAEIISTAQTQDMRLGSDNITGTLNGELSCGTYQDLFAAAFRGAWAAGASLAASTDLAFVAPNKITRTTGSFVTDGFKIGTAVDVAGATNAENNGRFVIADVTALEITIQVNVVNGIQQPLVDEAAGGSITVTTAGKVLIVPTSNRTNDSFTIEKYYETINTAEVYTGVKISTINFNFQPNAMATVAFGLLGKAAESNTGAYFTTPADNSPTSVLAGTRGALFVAGQRIATVTGLTIDQTGNMETGQVIGDRQTPDVFLGRFTASGQFTAYFENNDLWEKFRDEEELTITIRMDGDGTEGMVFTLPRVKLGGASKDDKEVGGIIQTVPFTALLYTGTEAKHNTTMVLQDFTL